MIDPFAYVPIMRLVRGASGRWMVLVEFNGPVPDEVVLWWKSALEQAKFDLLEVARRENERRTSGSPRPPSD